MTQSATKLSGLPAFKIEYVSGDGQKYIHTEAIEHNTRIYAELKDFIITDNRIKDITIINPTIRNIHANSYIHARYQWRVRKRRRLHWSNHYAIFISEYV
jgi:hypothetical protein